MRGSTLGAEIPIDAEEQLIEGISGIFRVQ